MPHGQTRQDMCRKFAWALWPACSIQEGLHTLALVSADVRKHLRTQACVQKKCLDCLSGDVLRHFNRQTIIGKCRHQVFFFFSFPFNSFHEYYLSSMSQA